MKTIIDCDKLMKGTTRGKGGSEGRKLREKTKEGKKDKGVKTFS